MIHIVAIFLIFFFWHKVSLIIHKNTSPPPSSNRGNGLRMISIIISRRRRRPGDGRYCNAPRPSVSVCLSVNFAGGVLYSFWYWLFFKISCFFVFHAISNIYKKNWCEKNQFFLISRFMLFPTLKKKQYSKVPLHLLVKWEVVSPNSR